MPLTFYALSGSPFSWKVWLALEHLAVPYDLCVLSADAGDLKSPAFLALNTRGKVPVIVDDGFALPESSAIIEYLEEVHGQPGRSLWPSDPRARAIARRFAAEVDGYIYPAVRRLVVLKARLRHDVELLMQRDGSPDPSVIAESRAALAGEFERLEGLVSSAFLAGDAPSAADYALYPLTAILMRVDAKAPGHDLVRVIGENVGSWRTRVEGLAYFARTLQPHWRTA